MKAQPSMQPTAAPQKNEQTTPPMPTTVPTIEYLKKVRTSVSSPDTNSSRIEPRVAMLYSFASIGML